mmetsp:Transcript_141623/g.394826  ORF Transcript_141623/g.394826 Transcript_141623/m.394826 type:complete len:300 (-) Transcript_141623:142-1041(-)
MSRIQCLAMAVALPLGWAQPSRLHLRGAHPAALASPNGTGAPFHLAWGEAVSLCLSIGGNQVGNGAPLQLQRCDTTWRSSGQNFHIDAGRIRMHQHPNYCVGIDDGDYSNGTQVQLWECNSQAKHQAWDFWHYGHIRASSSYPTSMCLTVAGDQGFSGAKVQLWSCGSAGGAGAAAHRWVQLALGAGGSKIYAVPNADKVCARPFSPVQPSSGACAEAAEALRPGSGCPWPEKRRWAQVVERDDRPTWPRGCYFYAACQGGCGLLFNPTGIGSDCPSQGDCMGIEVLCELSVPSIYENC